MGITLLGPGQVINILTVEISENASNLNLADLIKTEGWDGVLSVDAAVTIGKDVTVGSALPDKPAIETGTFPVGSTVLLNNMGHIISEGTAIMVSSPLTIENASGTIAGDPGLSNVNLVTFIGRGILRGGEV